VRRPPTKRPPTKKLVEKCPPARRRPGKRPPRKCKPCKKVYKKCNRKTLIKENKRLRIEILKYKKKHAALKQIYYWLSKLEKKLRDEKIYLSKKAERKLSVYKEWSKRVEKLKTTYESLKKEHEISSKKVSESSKSYKKLVKKLEIAKKELERLQKIYTKHSKTAERLYKEYQVSLKSSTLEKVEAELRLISLMRSKLSWIEELVKKWIKVRTVHHHHYILIEKVIHKPLVKGKCICPAVYRPACGADGITYSSSCVARCAGVRVEHEGECKCVPKPSVFQKKITVEKKTVEAGKKIVTEQEQKKVVIATEVKQTGSSSVTVDDKKIEEVKCQPSADGTRTCA
jgi:hypothetical protein